MSRFLFTMLPANDLGLPTRLVPIARELADRGHEVAMFNPAPAPTALIANAELLNLPMPERAVPDAPFDLTTASQAWDVEEMIGAVYSSEEFVRAMMAMHVDLMNAYKPDVVVDSFGPFGCMAARALKIPLVSVLQGNFHPESKGFLWWKGERPHGLPSATPMFNAVAAEYELAPMERCVELLAGDRSLIVGTPETDPVEATARVTYIGPIVWQRQDAELPEWVNNLDAGKPVVWVYSGNPRYAGAAASTAIDSIVVIRAAIAALADAPVHVVLTTGFQEIPEEVGSLPGNFHHAAYLPGKAMAARSDLMVHHGGHSSVMQGLAAGTPAVMIPTITERESNARRVAALGAGEIVMPVNCANGEKELDFATFGAAVMRVLAEPHYKAAAQRLAGTMRGMGGVRFAADLIEQTAS